MVGVLIYIFVMNEFILWVFASLNNTFLGFLVQVWALQKTSSRV